MLRKRLKKEEDAELEEGEEGKGKKGSSKKSRGLLGTKIRSGDSSLLIV